MAVSPSLLTCFAPHRRWTTLDSSTSDVTVTLLKLHAVVPFNGVANANKINLYEVCSNRGQPHTLLAVSDRWSQAWSAMTPSTAFALGGDMAFISGAGFNATENYTCVCNASVGMLKTAASVRNDHTLLCPLPAWGDVFPASHTEFYVMRGGTNVPLSSGNGLSKTFAFTPGWSSVIPSEAPSTGGTPLLIVASGLDATVKCACPLPPTDPCPNMALSRIAHVI